MPQTAVLLALVACLTVGPAFAAVAAPSAAQTAPEENAPGATAPGRTDNLSDKLNRSNGVIQPKEVDPAIEKPAPSAGDPNVLAPPGASGASPAPQAK